MLGAHTLQAIAYKDSVPLSTHPSAPKPAPTVVSLQVHVVKVGDTLTAIAAAAHTTIAKLAALNHIDPAKPIVIGQHLRVPSASVAASLAASRSDVRAMLDGWSGRLGVDPHLVRALAWMESGYQTRIVSDAGARGVLQTLPTTREYVETVLVGHSIPHTVDGDIGWGSSTCAISCRCSTATSASLWPAGTRVSAQCAARSLQGDEAVRRRRARPACPDVALGFQREQVVDRLAAADQPCLAAATSTAAGRGTAL